MKILNKLKEKVFHSNIKTDIDARQNIINANTHFSVLESYKAARTNLMFTMAEEKGCKKILVTSSITKEGKSTTTLNLAITFAQAGARVIVIDADLRRPRVHSYMGLKNNAGMAQYLGGFIADHHEIVRHVPEHNLDCITGGPIPPNPSELLLSKGMAELLELLSAEYDYIFVDSPPVNVVADSVSIAENMTGALLVVRQDYTTSEDLKQTLSKLEFGNIKILGYMLNATTEPRSHSYKKSYYRSGYYY
ncbi:MAG: CpsD/CapB family tyrosine-protein kinase [Ruminococcaceae bacterium]|nr:CpsD/CapB family tyrosine-protein kinase [Oscillospiraceae bacterium]